MKLLASAMMPLLLAAASHAQSTMNFVCNNQSGSQNTLTIDLNHDADGWVGFGSTDHR